MLIYSILILIVTYETFFIITKFVDVSAVTGSGMDRFFSKVIMTIFL
jgi:hypothetical protein